MQCLFHWHEVWALGSSPSLNSEASSAENGPFVEHSPAHTLHVEKKQENSISYCTAYINKGIRESKIFVAIITLVY